MHYGWDLSWLHHQACSTPKPISSPDQAIFDFWRRVTEPNPGCSAKTSMSMLVSTLDTAGYPNRVISDVQRSASHGAGFLGAIPRHRLHCQFKRRRAAISIQQDHYCNNTISTLLIAEQMHFARLSDLVLSSVERANMPPAKV